MPRCPNCHSPMTRVEEHEIRMHTCPGCFGTWIGWVPLVRLTRQARQGSAEGEPSLQELAALVVESNSTKVLRCPECSGTMSKDRFHPMIPVEIDRCPKCSGVWLDVGELPLLRRLYEELQKSDDPQVVALREKVARVNLETQDRLERARELRQQTRDPMWDSTWDDAAGMTLTTLVRILSRL